MFKEKNRYFKGFDSELKCRGMQYTIGQIHSAQDTSKPAKVCTNTALHFCDNLDYIPYRGSTDRICIVEPYSSPVDCDGTNYGASLLRVIRELPKETIDRYKKFCKYLKRNEDIISNHKLTLIQELQKRYPQLILCGSAAVFLHTGKVYERNEKSPIHDLDFVTPYYIRIEGDEEHKLSKAYEKLWEDVGFDDEGEETAKLGVLKVSSRDKWGSGNDFDECVYVNNVPVDVAVKPEQKYEWITFRGFRYKVATLTSILEAKLKYANNGQGKHAQDIQDLIKLPVVVKIAEI